MSTELQNAYESDMAVIGEDGSKTYVGNIEEADFSVQEQPKEVKSLDEL